MRVLVIASLLSLFGCATTKLDIETPKFQVPPLIIAASLDNCIQVGYSPEECVCHVKYMLSQYTELEVRQGAVQRDLEKIINYCAPKESLESVLQRKESQRISKPQD